MNAIIGRTYGLSIGEPYSLRCQNVRMPRSTETIWQRIEEALGEAGHPARGAQTAAAKMVGIRQPSVAGWKKGATPELKHVLILARKLNVCVEWIYTGRGPKRPGSDLPPDLGEIADFWERLPLDVRNEIVGFAKFKRSITFTGDPARLEGFHERITHAKREEDK